jgi:hypothetical protein
MMDGGWCGVFMVELTALRRDFPEEPEMVMEGCVLEIVAGLGIVHKNVVRCRNSEVRDGVAERRGAYDRAFGSSDFRRWGQGGRAAQKQAVANVLSRTARSFTSNFFFSACETWRSWRQ